MQLDLKSETSRAGVPGKLAARRDCPSLNLGAIQYALRDVNASLFTYLYNIDKSRS